MSPWLIQTCAKRSSNVSITLHHHCRCFLADRPQARRVSPTREGRRSPRRWAQSSAARQTHLLAHRTANVGQPLLPVKAERLNASVSKHLQHLSVLCGWRGGVEG